MPEPIPSQARPVDWQQVAALKPDVGLWLLAIAIGIAAAYGAIAFRLVIAGTQFLAFGVADERTLAHLDTLPWWQVMLAPALGGLLIGLLLKYVMPGDRAQGVPDVIEARALKGARIHLRTGLGSALITAIGLGAGASAGREGPVVHLGATIASAIAQRLSLNAAHARTLLGCGVAAAVSASFNAPLAGVLFAHEVVLGHYALRSFAPMAIASVAGALITRSHYGDFPAFIIPTYEIGSVFEFPAFVLLGLVCALVAVAFMRAVMFAQNIAEKIPAPDWSRPMVGGLMLGAMALVLPHTLGVGYETTDLALKEMFPLALLLVLIAAKVAATAITLASRFGGGVFSPSLYLGALTGAAFGLIATAAAPGMATASPGLYAIIGMGAVSAAVLGAPISTTLIVFELTGDYAVTIALLVAVSIATVISRAVVGRSFFYWQLDKRGHDYLEGGVPQTLLQTVSVSSFLVTRHEPHPRREDKFFVYPTDTLDQALSLMNAEGVSELAVVEASDEDTEIGVVTHGDALRAYNRALVDTLHEEHR